jgi:hypothetical protein
MSWAGHDIQDTYKVLVRNMSRGSLFDYPDTNWGMIDTFKYISIKKNSNTTI